MDRDWEFGTCPGSDDSDFFDWEVVEGRRRGWGGVGAFLLTMIYCGFRFLASVIVLLVALFFRVCLMCGDEWVRSVSVWDNVLKAACATLGWFGSLCVCGVAVVAVSSVSLCPSHTRTHTHTRAGAHTLFADTLSAHVQFVSSFCRFHQLTARCRCRRRTRETGDVVAAVATATTISLSDCLCLALVRLLAETPSFVVAECHLVAAVAVDSWMVATRLCCRSGKCLGMMEVDDAGVLAAAVVLGGSPHCRERETE